MKLENYVLIFLEKKALWDLFLVILFAMEVYSQKHFAELFYVKPVPKGGSTFTLKHVVLLELLHSLYLKASLFYLEGLNQVRLLSKSKLYFLYRNFKNLLS